jgi:uncharacterized OB-fold protein
MNGTWPRPEVDVWNREFWAATTEHRLTAQRCTSCHQLRFPAAPACAECLSLDLEWVDLSGRGEVQSWVVFHQVYFSGLAEAVPYNVVLVRLEEGLRFVSNVVGIPDSDIRIGMPVAVQFEDVDSTYSIPRFAPV